MSERIWCGPLPAPEAGYDLSVKDFPDEEAFMDAVWLHPSLIKLFGPTKEDVAPVFRLIVENCGRSSIWALYVGVGENRVRLTDAEEEALLNLYSFPRADGEQQTYVVGCDLAPFTDEELLELTWRMSRGQIAAPPEEKDRVWRAYCASRGRKGLGCPVLD